MSLRVDPCNDVYRLIGARNSEGASRDNAVSTLESCWTACTASTTCVALEFTNTNECWLHSSLTALDTFNANANINQYVREPCGGRLMLFVVLWVVSNVVMLLMNHKLAGSEVSIHFLS